MFRPCIDLHQGKVKQIVGETLDSSNLQTNFESEKDSSYYASLFKKHDLKGGHVIMLGPGNEDAAKKALKTYPDGLQVGGGINPENAETYLESGASHVIVTSYVFDGAVFSFKKLNQMVDLVGVDRLVLDLSCKKIDDEYRVVINRWKTLTNLVLNEKIIGDLEEYCDEFLIHASHVEGYQKGIDHECVDLLCRCGTKPITYAGGANTLQDLDTIHEKGQGRLGLTIGSALDIFGGNKICFDDVVKWMKRK